MNRSSGPVVWIGIITSACLPCSLPKISGGAFLLVLIICYFLQPATHRRCAATANCGAITGGGFIALLLLCAALLFPWISSHAVSWQDSLARYVEGGSLLLQKTMTGLEAQFTFLERASLSRNVSEQVATFTETFAQRYLTDFVLTLAAWLPALLLAPFLAFFFLRDGRRFTRFIGNAVPNAFFERTLYLMHEMDKRRALRA
jgi:predicted PurR-regulated permease PerM